VDPEHWIFRFDVSLDFCWASSSYRRHYLVIFDEAPDKPYQIKQGSGFVREFVLSKEIISIKSRREQILDQIETICFYNKTNSGTIPQNVLVSFPKRYPNICPFVFDSVPDLGPNPDPPDPRVFWPPGSGFTSQRLDPEPDPVLDPDPDPSSCKNNKKNLESYYFVTLFDF
jgi:hypothetical protein